MWINDDGGKRKEWAQGESGRRTGRRAGAQAGRADRRASARQRPSRMHQMEDETARGQGGGAAPKM